jgi:hypothetical protein
VVDAQEQQALVELLGLLAKPIEIRLGVRRRNGVDKKCESKEKSVDNIYIGRAIVILFRVVFWLRLLSA